MNKPHINQLIREQAHLIKHTFKIQLADAYEVLAIVFYKSPNYKSLKKHIENGETHSKSVKTILKLSYYCEDIDLLKHHIAELTKSLLSTIQCNLLHAQLSQFFKDFFNINDFIELPKLERDINGFKPVLYVDKGLWTLNSSSKNISSLIQLLKEVKLQRYESKYGERIACLIDSKEIDSHLSMQLSIYSHDGSCLFSNLIENTMIIRNQKFIIFSKDFIKLRKLTSSKQILKSLRYGRIFQEPKGFIEKFEDLDPSEEVQALPVLPKNYSDAINSIKLPKLSIEDLFSIFH